MVITITIDIYYIQGYFIYFGANRAYDLVVSVLLSIISIIYLYLSNVNIKKDVFAYAAIFVVFAMIGDFYELFDPFQGEIGGGDSGAGWDNYAKGLIPKEKMNISFARFGIDFVYYFTAIISIIILKSDFNINEIGRIIHSVNNLLKIGVAFGVLEFISKILLGSDLSLDASLFLFGTDTSTLDELRERNESYLLQGISREASHYANTLYYTFVFLFLEMKIIKRTNFMILDKIEMVVALFLMCVSGSFSSLEYIFALFLLLIYWHLKDKRKKEIGIFIGLMLTVCLITLFILMEEFDLSGYFFERIEVSILVLSLLTSGNLIGVSGLTSAVPRFISIYDSIINILQRPFFGLGMGVEWSHSTWISFLSNFGLLGLWAWMKLIFSGYNYHKIPVLIIIVVPFVLSGAKFWAAFLNTIILVEAFRKGK